VQRTRLRRAPAGAVFGQRWLRLPGWLDGTAAPLTPPLGRQCKVKSWEIKMDNAGSTTNLIISGLMGILGGLLTIPINALFAFWLKKYEIEYEHRLDELAKKRELLLQHKLDLERIKFAQKVKGTSSMSSSE